jgi:hypothetical protein
MVSFSSLLVPYNEEQNFFSGSSRAPESQIRGVAAIMDFRGKPLETEFIFRFHLETVIIMKGSITDRINLNMLMKLSFFCFFYIITFRFLIFL